MDLSVLERQRVIMFQRMYQHSHSWPQQPNDQTALHSLADHHQLLAGCWKPDHQATSTSNHSSLTGVKVSKPDQQCNASLASKKRKAEFDVEEIECKDEAAEEQSEITMKVERESSSNTCSKGSSKASGPEKPDYIHVRARRGQATDSHSLAERARREKISKKMKCLQDLVPGCNKVTGKAGMLDEIINYVQSLQKQVEFLSMKLAAFNPRVDVNIDSFLTKEIPAYIAATQLEAASTACFPYSPMLQQGTLNRGPEAAVDQSQMLSQKPGLEEFCDSAYITQPQQLSSWESDWPSLFNVGFH